MNQRIFAEISDNFTFGKYTYFITNNGMLWKRLHGTIHNEYLGQLNIPIMLSEIAKIIDKDQPGTNADFRWLGAD